MQSRFRDQACKQYEALLEDHLNGELGREDAKNISEHLAICGHCRRALEVAQSSTALFHLASLESTCDVGPGFARTVMARRLSFWQPVVTLSWRFTASAAVALALLVAYAVTGSRQPLSMVATVGQTEMHDLLSPDPTVLSEDQDEFLTMVAAPSYDNN
jgi:predicted anti-sigma-YlaC factor YlaD